MKRIVTLLKLPVSAEDLAKLFEAITGRKVTEQEMREMRCNGIRRTDANSVCALCGLTMVDCLSWTTTST